MALCDSTDGLGRKERGARELKLHYDYHNATLELAMSDASGVCRLLAYATLRLGREDCAARRDRSKQWRDLRRAAGNDIYALSGLAKNPSLSLRELRWVVSHARTLASSLKSERNLWVNFGEDEGYPTSEEDLRVTIHRDIERRIRSCPSKSNCERLDRH